MIADEVFVQMAEARLRVRFADGWVQVDPNHTGRCDGYWPDRGELTFLTAWNPAGGPADPEDNDAGHSWLFETLETSGLVFGTAALIGADASWAQQAAVVTGLDEDEARWWARECGQPVLITWADDGILTRSVEGTRRELTTWTSTLIARRPCPMRPFHEGTLAPCEVAAGLSGGSARAVAAEWSARRHSLLRAVGCDVCGGDAPFGAKGTSVIVGAIQDSAPCDPSVLVRPHRPASRPVQP